MLKFHPDKHRGDDAVVAGAAAARTARIGAAYEVLRDPALRELYDMEFRCPAGLRAVRMPKWQNDRTPGLV